MAPRDKRSNVLPFPRYVRPENIEIGDVIRVTFPPDDQGIKRTREGTVHTRSYEGSDRVLRTREGGDLLVWNPHYKAPTVTLLGKSAPPQPMLSLFESNDELNERVNHG